MQANPQTVIPDLQALSITGDQAFSLVLASSDLLECHRIVRRVPGKRLVCQGTWQGHRVFAKIFLGSQARRHARRDRQGVEWLAMHKLSTPPLLYAATLPECEVLIYEAIDSSRNAEEVMATLENRQNRLQLALAITKAIAEHHEAGLVQTDLYLKNFLVKGERIYTLDGDGIRRLSPWNRRRQALCNLATLWSKLDASNEDWFPQLYEAYCRHRGWSPSQAQLNNLIRRASHIRHSVFTEYADRKVLRECTDVHVEHSYHQFIAVDRLWASQASSLLDDLDAQLEQGVRLKTGNTCTVGLIEFNGRKIVVKRYNIKNLRHGLGRALRRSRAALSWSNTYRLRIAAIATAAPVAMLEERRGVLRGRAWFLAEYAEGPDAAEWMAQATTEQRAQAATHIAQLMHKMQRLRFAHGDLKATNIKIVDGLPVLIDLDSLKEIRCDWLFRRRHARDLKRLLKNWADDPTVLEIMTQALRTVYGNDPALAGIKIIRDE